MPAHPHPVDPHAEATLATCAQRQGGVFQWRQAIRAGFTASQIRTRIRSGAWQVLRHGVLVDATCRAEAPPHLLECASRWLALPNHVVLSHESAGTLHGLPLVDAPSEPIFTVERSQRGSVAGAHLAALPASHMTTFRGLPLTTPERTVVDLLRASRDRYDAQALADAAVRAGFDLTAILYECSRWPGIVQARAAWELRDAKAESPLESRTRLWLFDGGLPTPESQVKLFDRQGRFVARVDFLFRAQRTIVEADGRLKYTEASVLWEEKRREDWLRELGFEVVRATWADGQDHGADLVRRVLRAFDRTAGRAA